jgi:Domain of unknown function (DUF397)
MIDVPPATARWRKSTHSNDYGACVEVTAWRTQAHQPSTAPVIAVRDSKDPGGPMLTFSGPAWQAFLATLG